jgi:hypothetical protein
MGPTRRSVLTSALAASALAWGGLSVPTNAAPGQFKLKFGSDSPESSPVTFHMREVAKKVQEASAGSIEIGVFPNSQLGSSTDMLAQVRSGALDMYVISPGVALDPRADRHHQRRWLLLAELRQHLAGHGRRGRRSRPQRHPRRRPRGI